MDTVSEQLSQTFFQLASCCDVECHCCDRLKNIELVKDFREHIYQGTFFNYYPRSKLINIVAGDPQTADLLLLLCKFLFAEGVHVRLWIHPSFLLTVLTEVLPYIHDVAIIIPSTELNMRFLMPTEVARTELAELMEFLRLEQRSFLLVHRVVSNYIAYLPDFYAFCHDYSCRLWLHYDKFLTQDEKKHVNYYARYAFISVFPDCIYRDSLCRFVPAQLCRNKILFLYYLCKQFVKRMFQRFDLS